MLFQTGADNDGGAKYLKLCQHIYGHFISGQTQFFYSCADLHTYQAGTVMLAAADGASHQIRINQQIAGTGGTTLETEYATIGSLPLQRQGPATTTVDGVDITYDMVVASHSHGFLHWTESTGPENGGLSLLVEFIPVRVRESNDNAGGTRRRRRRGIRSTMLRRQEHRQHHRRKDNRNRTRHWKWNDWMIDLVKINYFIHSFYHFIISSFHHFIISSFRDFMIKINNNII